jgi:hypothetical protein
MRRLGSRQFKNRGRKACPEAGIQEDEHLLVHPAYITIIPTRQQVLTRMRGSVGYLDATECEDVKYLYICKGRGSNGGKPSSSIPISTNNFYQFQIRYQQSGSKTVSSSLYNKH